MKQIKILTSILILLAFAVFLSGCKVDSVNTSVQRYIGGNRAAINDAEEVKIDIESKNPVFDSEEEIEAQDLVAGQVDQLMKKVLKSTYSDSKLNFANNVGNTPFTLRYVTKKRIGKDDGGLLHKTLIDEGGRFKNDSLPNFIDSRNSVEFSVYHDFGGRSYILAVVMDLGEQTIWVNVY